MSDSTISVVIPTYNRAHFLARSINSALSQLTESDEVIVVDDGSEDETERVVLQFGRKVRYIKSRHQGAGAARNLGIKASRNPLVAFLDSDDEWMNNKIRLQREFMQARPDILFSFTNITFTQPDAKTINYSLRTWPGANKTWEEIFGQGKKLSSIFHLPEGVSDCYFFEGDLYPYLLTGCYVTVITLMVRREQAGDALHFAEDLKIYEDWECFARLAQAGKCAYFDCETAWNHSHRGNRLTDFGGFERIDALTTIAERIYGKDQKFLEKYANYYHQILSEYRLSKIKGLLLLGNTQEAKRELEKLSERKYLLHFLTFLPKSLAAGISKIIRRFRRSLNISNSSS